MKNRRDALLRGPVRSAERFHPMGQELEVVSDHPVPLAAARSAFAAPRPPGPAPAAAPLRLRLLVRGDGAAPQALDRLPAPRFHHRGARACQASGEAARVLAHRDRGRAWGRFAPAALGHPAFLRHHFLELALYWLLPGRGLTGVHAAAVVREGRALLLRGPSGSGKTTLAFAALDRGFRALAEDVVWIGPGGGRWWGLPAHFHFLPSARRLFPALRAAGERLPIHGRVKLEVELPPERQAHGAEPGPVVLLARRPGGVSRLAPLIPAEARRLWAAGAAGTEAAEPAYGERVEALLALGAYRLELGDDLDTALDLLAALAAT